MRAESLDVQAVLFILKRRYAYWDGPRRALSLSPEEEDRIGMLRHEVWACHKLITEAFGMPSWDPVPKGRP
jgi:hypothetical protein